LINVKLVDALRNQKVNIEGKLPKSASSRTITFALRKEVAAQIQVMSPLVVFLPPAGRSFTLLFFLV
jgi:hypothetical protein